MSNLTEILKWLGDGDCFCIYTSYSGRCFYKTQEVDKIEGRMIYLDVSSHPGLLDDGEWNYYIKEGGYYELDKVPTEQYQGNKITYFSLGY